MTTAPAAFPSDDPANAPGSAEDDAPLFRVRLGTEDDVPFVYSSFLRSYRDAPAVVGIPNSVYYPAQHLLIERLLTIATVGVACAPTDVGQIFGYIIGRHAGAGHTVIDWLYVKHPFRGFGIARALVGNLTQNATAVSFTHRPRNVDRFLTRSAYKTYQYNPYLIATP